MSRGGKREGAGRPKNSGKWGEQTKAVRLPVSQVDGILKLLERRKKREEKQKAEIENQAPESEPEA